MARNYVWIVERQNEQGEWEPDFSMMPDDGTACRSKKDATAWCQTFRHHSGNTTRYRPAKYVREEEGE